MASFWWNRYNLVHLGLFYTITSYHVIAILTSIFVGVTIWRWRIAGIADSFAIIAMAVILPVHYEFVMMPIMTLVVAFFIVVIGTMMYNISLNLAEMIRTKNWIFFEFRSESKFKKAFAFLSMHRKRKHESFVTSAEKNNPTQSGDKSFVFFSSRNGVQRNSQLQSNGMYVQNVPPLVSYMFGIAVFLLLPGILNVLS